MKKSISLLVLTTIFLLNSNTSNAEEANYYAQKQNELEIKRLNQEIAQLKKDKLAFAETIRELEKITEDLNKKITSSGKRVEDLLDLWVNFENVTMPNLSLSDKELALRINKSNSELLDKIAETNKSIEDRNPIWNWGEQERDCPSLGKHQQVKTILSEDQSAAMTYLCFDGKVLHLKTVSNLPISN